MYTFIHIYIYICVCVCVCVYIYILLHILTYLFKGDLHAEVTSALEFNILKTTKLIGLTHRFGFSVKRHATCLLARTR